MKDIKIAVFISPHGFGHAARCCAVMDALARQNPAVHFDIFTQVPEWFFQQSLTCRYRYHVCLTDIGLIQSSPVVEDVTASVAALQAFIPFDEQHLAELAIKINGSSLVIADIAPLGLKVAETAGVPSILIENFTWDWIYDGFNANREFDFAIEYFRQCFALASWRIQTEPICQEDKADLLCGPISRQPRLTATQFKRLLQLPEDSRLCLLTMGGIPLANCDFVKNLKNLPKQVYVLVPGAAEQEKREGQLILLPRQSTYYHPDIVNAADWVMGKLGYSTVAEVAQSRCRLLYISRPGFKESTVLENYVVRHFEARHVSNEAFSTGQWLASLEAMPDRLNPEFSKESNAADQVASYLMKCLSG